jgi:hypothetical protein
MDRYQDIFSLSSVNPLYLCMIMMQLLVSLSAVSHAWRSYSTPKSVGIFVFCCDHAFLAYYYPQPRRQGECNRYGNVGRVHNFKISTNFGCVGGYGNIYNFTKFSDCIRFKFKINQICLNLRKFERKNMK